MKMKKEIWISFAKYVELDSISTTKIWFSGFHLTFLFSDLIMLASA